MPTYAGIRCDTGWPNEIPVPVLTELPTADSGTTVVLIVWYGKPTGTLVF